MPIDPSEAINAASSRLITDSILGAILVIVCVAWGVSIWWTRRNHEKELAFREAMRLELKQELLDERESHQQTRVGLQESTTNSLRAAATMDTTLNRVIDAVQRLQTPGSSQDRIGRI